MNKSKKITLGVLAAVAAFAIPVVTVVSCGKKSTNKNTQPKKNIVSKVVPQPTTKTEKATFKEDKVQTATKIMTKISNTISLKAKDIANKLKVTGRNGSGIINGIYSIDGLDISLSFDKVKKITKNGIDYISGENGSIQNGETVTITCSPKKGYEILPDFQYKVDAKGILEYKFKINNLKTIIDKNETMIGAGGAEPFYNGIVFTWFKIPANITTITVNSFSKSLLPEGFIIPSTVTKIITMKEYAKTHKPIELMDKEEAFNKVVLPKGFKDESNTKVKYDFSKNPVEKGYIWDEATRSVIKK